MKKVYLIWFSVAVLILSFIVLAVASNPVLGSEPDDEKIDYYELGSDAIFALIF